MNYIKILAKPFRQVKKFYHSSLTQYPTQLANPGLANPGQLSRLKILKSLAKPVISSDKTCMVSVVIGSYNRRPLLEKAIQSVRDNQIRVPYEIIVIDGGSTDGSLEWLIQQKDIITIIQHNRGEFQGKP
ncbi:MAG: glycosyltransferase, partial [Moorea sp. SIO4G2]|nr:glycosyltransferase [Moorena sp. SIO4G2]